MERSSIKKLAVQKRLPAGRQGMAIAELQTFRKIFFTLGTLRDAAMLFLAL
jgi:hypothetical protein